VSTALAEATEQAAGVLESAGPVMVWLIVLSFVFTECAFIVGLFLPGDSLLFAAGVVLAQHDHEASAWALSLAATATAVVGNMVGYYIGNKTGNALIARRTTRTWRAPGTSSTGAASGRSCSPGGCRGSARWPR
jgi:membrane-associated protein